MNWLIFLASIVEKDKATYASKNDRSRSFLNLKSWSKER
jgi:hypothetical protein